ncbi:MAG: hypothetical protein MUO97_05730, partial [Dehalococcoidia bacterium]|nr:hypothetical protein [Dehalococcoidia bacterium]
MTGINKYTVRPHLGINRATIIDIAATTGVMQFLIVPLKMALRLRSASTSLWFRQAYTQFSRKRSPNINKLPLNK